MIDIVDLTREWTTTNWLCADHQTARAAQRWSIKVIGQVDGRCADCESYTQAARAARGELSPPVDFAPNRAESRLPTHAELVTRGLAAPAGSGHADEGAL